MKYEPQIYTFNIKNFRDNYVIENKQTIFIPFLKVININEKLFYFFYKKSIFYLQDIFIYTSNNINNLPFT